MIEPWGSNSLVDEDYFNETQAEDDADVQRALSWITPDSARQFTTLAQTYPSTDPAVLLGISAAGIPSDMPWIRDVTELAEEGNRNWFMSNVYDKLIVGGIRNTVMLTESVYNNALHTRGLRAYVGYNQGMSPGEALEQSEGSFLSQIIQAERAGQPWTMGSGYFPQPQDPANSPEYRAAFEASTAQQRAQGVPEEELDFEAANAAGMAAMPVDIAQRAIESAERIKITSPLGGMPVPVSIGSLLTFQILRPGNAAYQVASGMIDLPFRLALDPLNVPFWELEAALKARRLARPLAAAGGALEPRAAPLPPDLTSPITVAGKKIRTIEDFAEEMRSAIADEDIERLTALQGGLEDPTVAEAWAAHRQAQRTPIPMPAREADPLVIATEQRLNQLPVRPEALTRKRMAPFTSGVTEVTVADNPISQNGGWAVNKGIVNRLLEDSRTWATRQVDRIGPVRPNTDIERQAVYRVLEAGPVGETGPNADLVTDFLANATDEDFAWFRARGDELQGVIDEGLDAEHRSFTRDSEVADTVAWLKAAEEHSLDEAEFAERRLEDLENGLRPRSPELGVDYERTVASDVVPPDDPFAEMRSGTPEPTTEADEFEKELARYEAEEPDASDLATLEQEIGDASGPPPPIRRARMVAPTDSRTLTQGIIHDGNVTTVSFDYKLVDDAGNRTWPPPDDTRRRVMITGTRPARPGHPEDWLRPDDLPGPKAPQSRAAVRAVLTQIAAQDPETVIVHGMARGVDKWADEIAQELGLAVERHPVQSPIWERKVGGRKRMFWGHRRNERMISTGIDEVYAFPVEGGKGTQGAIEKSYSSGIKVTEIWPGDPTDITLTDDVRRFAEVWSGPAPDAIELDNFPQLRHIVDLYYKGGALPDLGPARFDEFADEAGDFGRFGPDVEYTAGEGRPMTREVRPGYMERSNVDRLAEVEYDHVHQAVLARVTALDKRDLQRLAQSEFPDVFEMIEKEAPRAQRSIARDITEEIMDRARRTEEPITGAMIESAVERAMVGGTGVGGPSSKMVNRLRWKVERRLRFLRQKADITGVEQQEMAALEELYSRFPGHRGLVPGTRGQAIKGLTAEASAQVRQIEQELLSHPQGPYTARGFEELRTPERAPIEYPPDFEITPPSPENFATMRNTELSPDQIRGFFNAATRQLNMYSPDVAGPTAVTKARQTLAAREGYLRQLEAEVKEAFDSGNPVAVREVKARRHEMALIEGQARNKRAITKLTPEEIYEKRTIERWLKMDDRQLGKIAKNALKGRKRGTRMGLAAVDTSQFRIFLDIDTMPSEIEYNAARAKFPGTRPIQIVDPDEMLVRDIDAENAVFGDPRPIADEDFVPSEVRRWLKDRHARMNVNGEDAKRKIREFVPEAGDDIVTETTIGAAPVHRTRDIIVAGPVERNVYLPTNLQMELDQIVEANRILGNEALVPPKPALPAAAQTLVDAPEKAPSTVRVGNIKNGDPFDVYIGRDMPGHPDEGWGNVFHVDKPVPARLRPLLDQLGVAYPDGNLSRGEAVRLYRAWMKHRIRTEPGLLDKLADLRGKTLGCWCVPKKCHGEALAEMADYAASLVEELGPGATWSDGWRQAVVGVDPAGIRSFTGDNAFLSNFQGGPVTYEGVTYPTLEHAFQAAKTMDPERRAAIAAAATPGKAKAMGRALELRPDWEQVKERVMADLLAEKFAPGSENAQRLLATGDEPLVEGNTWGDRYWGEVKGQGQNRLGHLLMEQREKLRGVDVEEMPDVGLEGLHELEPGLAAGYEQGPEGLMPPELEERRLSEMEDTNLRRLTPEQKDRMIGQQEELQRAQAEEFEKPQIPEAPFELGRFVDDPEVGYPTLRAPSWVPDELKEEFAERVAGRTDEGDILADIPPEEIDRLQLSDSIWAHRVTAEEMGISIPGAADPGSEWIRQAAKVYNETGKLPTYQDIPRGWEDRWAQMVHRIDAEKSQMATPYKPAPAQFVEDALNEIADITAAPGDEAVRAYGPDEIRPDPEVRKWTDGTTEIVPLAGNYEVAIPAGLPENEWYDAVAAAVEEAGIGDELAALRAAQDEAIARGEVTLIEFDGEEIKEFLELQRRMDTAEAIEFEAKVPRPEPSPPREQGLIDEAREAQGIPTEAREAELVGGAPPEKPPTPPAAGATGPDPDDIDAERQYLENEVARIRRWHTENPKPSQTPITVEEEQRLQAVAAQAAAARPLYDAVQDFIARATDSNGATNQRQALLEHLIRDTEQNWGGRRPATVEELATEMGQPPERIRQATEWLTKMGMATTDEAGRVTLTPLSNDQANQYFDWLTEVSRLGDLVRPVTDNPEIMEYANEFRRQGVIDGFNEAVRRLVTERFTEPVPAPTGRFTEDLARAATIARRAADIKDNLDEIARLALAETLEASDAAGLTRAGLRVETRGFTRRGFLEGDLAKPEMRTHVLFDSRLAELGVDPDLLLESLHNRVTQWANLAAEDYARAQEMRLRAATLVRQAGLSEDDIDFFAQELLDARAPAQSSIGPASGVASRFETEILRGDHSPGRARKLARDLVAYNADDGMSMSRRPWMRPETGEAQLARMEKAGLFNWIAQNQSTADLMAIFGDLPDADLQRLLVVSDPAMARKILEPHWGHRIREVPRLRRNPAQLISGRHPKPTARSMPVPKVKGAVAEIFPEGLGDGQMRAVATNDSWMSTMRRRWMAEGGSGLVMLDRDNIKNALNRAREWMDNLGTPIEQRDMIMAKILMADPDKLEAWEPIKKMLINTFREELLKDGYDARFVRELIDQWTWFDGQKQNFITDAQGNPLSTSTQGVFTGYGGVDPQETKLAELSAIFEADFARRMIVLPDISGVRRATSGFRKMQRSLIKWKAAPPLLEQHRYHTVLSQINSIWKDAALLRFGWPVKIITDELARMAAVGMAEYMTPTQMIAYVTGKGDGTLIGGTWREEAELYGSIGTGWLRDRKTDSPLYGTVFDFDHRNWRSETYDHPMYWRTLRDRIEAAYQSPMPRMLATRSIDETIDYFTNTPAGRAHITYVVKNAKKGSAMKKLDDPVALRLFLEQDQAVMAHLAGGRMMYRAPELGKTSSYKQWRWNNGDIVAEADLPRGLRKDQQYWIKDRGHQFVWDLYANGANGRLPDVSAVRMIAMAEDGSGTWLYYPIPDGDDTAIGNLGFEVARITESFEDALAAAGPRGRVAFIEENPARRALNRARKSGDDNIDLPAGYSPTKITASSIEEYRANPRLTDTDIDNEASIWFDVKRVDAEEAERQAKRLQQYYGVNEVTEIDDVTGEVTTKEVPTGPFSIPVPVTNVRGGSKDEESLRAALYHVFTGFSDIISRSTFGKLSYWDESARIYLYVDDTMRGKIAAKAKRAGMDNTFKRMVEKQMRQAGYRELPKPRLLDIDEVDIHETAMWYSTATVRDILYDQTKVGNISDAARLIVPFAEAFWEVITRWSKLMNPAYNPRAARNMRRVEMAFNEMHQGGWFQEDEFGNEVFRAPASMSFLSNVGVTAVFNPKSPLFVDPTSPAGLQPGIGPIVQFPAGIVYPHLPTWARDPFAQAVWGDFPAPPNSLEGAIMGVTPTMYKQFIATLFSEQYRQMYADEMLGIGQAILATGSPIYDPRTPQGKARLEEDMRRGGSSMLMVKGLSAFFMPGQPRMEAAIKIYTDYGNGEIGEEWIGVDMLRSEWFAALEWFGTQEAAYSYFINRFGIDPFAFTAESYEVYERPNSRAAYNTMIDHPEIREKAKITAMAFLDDDPNGDFFYLAYRDKLETAASVRVTEDQLAENYLITRGYYEKNKIDRDYENLRAEAEQMLGRDTEAYATRVRELNQTRGEMMAGIIAEYFAGDSQPAPDGVPTRPTNAEALSEIRDIGRDPEGFYADLRARNPQYVDWLTVLDQVFAAADARGTELGHPGSWWMTAEYGVDADGEVRAANEIKEYVLGALSSTFSQITDPKARRAADWAFANIVQPIINGAPPGEFWMPQMPQWPAINPAAYTLVADDMMQTPDADERLATVPIP